ncbi:MAG: trypsin-like peptidase domain-containing protein [Gemmatimonadetes bacterium]|nr:trypsin-like peptidase domain-containing protein [Gemmatimonadota bacterium]
MRAEFRITSGSRAGQREVFEKSVVVIGRHPANDFRFDANNDPDVSSKHAEVRIVGHTVMLRDLDSTNGTFLNGKRISSETTLRDGDIIAFGDSGPRVTYHDGSDADAPGATRASLAHGSPAVGASAGAGSAGRPRRDTTMRIAEAVEEQTGKLRIMIGGLAGLVIIGVGIAYWAGNRGSAEARQQVAALLQQNDSLARMFDNTVTQLQGRSAGIDAALQAARRESDDLRRRLQAAASGGNAADVAAIAQDLETSASRQRALMGAARPDWETVTARNAPAMVFIVVQAEDGTNSSGTGFNVSPSGLIVTNRHVVRDAGGRMAKKIVVKFENSDRPFQLVTVVKVSESDELAWLKLEGGGRYPTVLGVARTPTLRVGAPVGLIGYPLGTGTAGMDGDISSIKPVSTLTVGTASKVLGETLQLDVYAAQGSSGSPVFNTQGLVVGVLYGSPTDSNGRIIYAVPSSRLAAQMPPEGAAIVK